MATHKQGNKETSNNQRPKNEMKAKPKDFWQDKFSRMIQLLKQLKAHKSKEGLKEKLRMALE